MHDDIVKEIKGYISNGIYCPIEIFNRIYYTAVIKPSTLRELIATVKNGY